MVAVHGKEVTGRPGQRVQALLGLLAAPVKDGIAAPEDEPWNRLIGRAARTNERAERLLIFTDQGAVDLRVSGKEARPEQRLVEPSQEELPLVAGGAQGRDGL